MQQGSPAWKTWRREGIGGSDIATILGLSPFEDATRENLIREKVDGWEKERNWAMTRGTRMEPTARGAYCRERKCTARPVCVEHDSVSWARVSLDGLCSAIAGAARANLTWILELKCPNWQTHSMALAGYVPDYYECQCQWQLWVAGLHHCEFASFTEHSRFDQDNRVGIVELTADNGRQMEILQAASEFWYDVADRKAAKRVGRVTAGI